MRKWMWVVLGTGSAGLSGLILAWLMRRRQSTAFKDKVVLVTGASSGIGRATAKAFAEQGAHLVLTARRAVRLNELADEIAHTAASTLVIPADISQIHDLHAIIEQIEKTYGRLDILVNNAGVGAVGRFQKLDPDKIAWMVDINLHSPMYLTRLALPLMPQNNGGHIVFVSSIVGALTGPGQHVYGATKKGLIGFADAMRRELTPTGIGVTTLMPGFTRTPMIGGGSREAMQKQLKGILSIPGIRLDEPEDVARAMLRAVYKNQPNVVTGGVTMKLLETLSRWSPATLDNIYRKIGSERWLNMLESEAEKVL